MKSKPEDERLILCRGYDWTSFECVGKFVRHKVTKQVPNPGSRFCIQNGDGSFTPASQTWKDIESWEYLD